MHIWNHMLSRLSAVTFPDFLLVSVPTYLPISWPHCTDHTLCNSYQLIYPLTTSSLSTFLLPGFTGVFISHPPLLMLHLHCLAFIERTDICFTFDIKCYYYHCALKTLKAWLQILTTTVMTSPNKTKIPDTDIKLMLEKKNF